MWKGEEISLQLGLVQRPKNKSDNFKELQTTKNTIAKDIATKNYNNK